MEASDNYNDLSTPKQSSYARDGCSRVSMWMVDGWLGLDWVNQMGMSTTEGVQRVLILLSHH